MTGPPFVKDYLVTIKAESLLYDLSTKYTEFVINEEREKADEELRKREKPSKEEFFKIMLYGEENLQNLTKEILEVAQPDIDQMIQTGVKESTEVQQLMEFYEDEINGNRREEEQERVDPLEIQLINKQANYTRSKNSANVSLSSEDGDDGKESIASLKSTLKKKSTDDVQRSRSYSIAVTSPSDQSQFQQYRFQIQRPTETSGASTIIRNEIIALKNKLLQIDSGTTDPQEIEQRKELQAKINFLSFKLETEVTKE